MISAFNRFFKSSTVYITDNLEVTCPKPLSRQQDVKFVRVYYSVTRHTRTIIATSYDEILDYGYKTFGSEVWLMWRSKPLRRGLTLEMLGCPREMNIEVHFPLRGGSEPQQEPIWADYRVAKFERAMKIQSQRRKIQKRVRKLIKNYEEVPFDVQSRSSLDTMFEYAARGMNTKFAHIDNVWINKLIEDLMIFIKLLGKANVFDDYYMAAVVFLKFRCGNEALITPEKVDMLVSYFNDLFKQDMEVQSGDFSDGNPFVKLRNILDKYDTIKESKIYKKLYKFMMYALSMSLFVPIGIDMDYLSYTKLEQEAMKRKYHKGPDFIYCVADTLLFCCERGYQCLITGTMEPLFHDGSRYEEWFDECYKLKRQSILMSDPEPHGLNKYQYLSDLEKIIEQGKSIVKFATSIGSVEKGLAKKLLNDIEMLKSEETTRKAAQKTRHAPFSVLLYGGSGIGKSTLLDVMFYTETQVSKLPHGDDFKYVRNFQDEFWSGFSSCMHFIVLDDVAYMHPNSAMGGDPSLNEVIRIANNVAFVTNQAELADKGRVPLRPYAVVATTNTPHLNAHNYFSCPLAVQRRLPFVIDARPKPEYLKDGQMLDASKLPPSVPGQFPDYWLFDIYRIIPDGEERIGQRGKMDTANAIHYNNIHDFLQWYAQTMRAHHDNQKMMEENITDLRSVHWCNKCDRAQYTCNCTDIQSHIIYDISYWLILLKMLSMLITYVLKPKQTISDCRILMNSIISKVALWWMRRFVKRLYIHYMTHFVLFFIPFRSHVEEHFGQFLATTPYARGALRQMGDTVSSRFKTPVLLVSLIVSTTAMLTMYRAHSASQKTVEVQGDVESTGTMPKATDTERVNVWYKDDYVTTSFDVSASSASYKSLGMDACANKLANNVIYMRSWFINDEGRRGRRNGNIIGICGHHYLTNNHNLPTYGNLDIELYRSGELNGVNSNVKFVLTQEQIVRYPNLDLAFFQITALPPCKNIVDLFMSETLEGTWNSTLISREETGFAKKRVIRKSKRTFAHIDDLNHTYNVWSGHITDMTNTGDCGAMLMGFSEAGCCILGIHIFLRAALNEQGALVVTRQMIQAYLDTQDIVIQSGEPKLDLENFVTPVVDLHPKSVFRYIPEGKANIYGSLAGFRPRLRSKVQRSMMCEYFEMRGYTVKNGPPVMEGWEPHNIAAVEMVNPVTRINQTLLRKCGDAYLNEVTSILKESIIEMVHPYDLFTTVNGAAGVAYVDKMNRNTSMGFPWKKSKKYFLRKIPPQNGLYDPVEFDESIIDETNRLLSVYKSSQRGMPVFTEHLKDEPKSFKKIAEKKTRVFTGGSAPYAILMRKYYLSLVRLIQNHQLVFESAPGMNVHSGEWTILYNYLTKFGKDTMIAGDYGRFDKSMPACVILESFRILIEIARASGNYSNEDITVMFGIAEDTAYPLMDFNGDLVEFFGSNPSGHPLTVIINCLANCLYMRYCWALKADLKDFKQNVALITYGDDNAMGVHKSASWFNHTYLQDTLASIGITYTMADKETLSIPYINISEISFLKRKWVWDNDLKAFACPLEHDSIEKSLMTIIPSKTVTKEEQAIDILSSAYREYFWYGKEIFEEKSKMFHQAIKDLDLTLYYEQSKFPTWQNMCDSYWGARKRPDDSECIAN